MYIVCAIIKIHHNLLTASVLDTNMICTKHGFSIIYECMYVFLYKYNIEFWKRRYAEPTCLKIPGEDIANAHTYHVQVQSEHKHQTASNPLLETAILLSAALYLETAKRFVTYGTTYNLAYK